MLRFSPSRTYLTAAAVALGMAVFSAWCAWSWWPAAIPAVLLLASAGLVLWLGLRPAVEIGDTVLRVGSQEVPWDTVRRVDQTNWISPMVLNLAMADGSRMRIVFPGDAISSNQLLELIQKRARHALLNGIPHAQIYGEVEKRPETTAPPLPAPRYRILTEEDEAEVERLYQRLRTAGRLDPDK